jgi:hypothetical protein
MKPSAEPEGEIMEKLAQARHIFSIIIRTIRTGRKPGKPVVDTSAEIDGTQPDV